MTNHDKTPKQDETTLLKYLINLLFKHIDVQARQVSEKNKDKTENNTESIEPSKNRLKMSCLQLQAN